MLLRSKTGTATLVQFIIGVSLSFLSTLISIIGGCFGSGVGECVSNALVSLLLVLIMVGGYAVLLAIGYAAQERRSQRLALILMACEAAAAFVFLFDARHAPDLFDRLINLGQFLVAAWVIFLAFRQFRAKSGRMVRLPKR